MGLTVKEILKRPHFQDVEILAGKKGLKRKVSWAHIVEINTFGHLLNGQEVILTTGMNWDNEDTEKCLHYLQQLLDHHASALCIELGTHMKNVPQEMLTLAESRDFPIIVFKKEVKFIDIMRDLHKMILGYQDTILWELENLHKKWNHTLIHNGSIGDLLKILHQATKKQIALVHDQEQYRFFPTPPKRKQQKWMKQLERDGFPSHYPAYPIQFLNKTIAYLYILEKQESISLFDDLSANRCSEFLNSYFWKYYQQKETREIKQNEWIIEALRGQLSPAAIIEKIHQENPTINLKGVIVGVIPKSDRPMSKEKRGDFSTETLMLIRSILDKNGFYLMTTEDKSKNHYILVLINQLDHVSLYQRLDQSLQGLKDSDFKDSIPNDLKWISFGKMFGDFGKLPISYETALITLNYQRKMGLLPKPFYNNLSVYRLIHQLEDMRELKDIITDYIGPLISYDRDKGGELLKTYQVYLKNLGSKNDTARELFIVRQTLYHRLERIEQLIGEDYMNPEKRIMAEFAIYALDYLNKTKAETL
ncbi:hypothetical protein FHP05_05370 [Cerasibacillus terrae]|uniref:PucR family transcriptional regulator n=1 Tax=Cerasibacillus terrae TaxID=2498845 RepID=A0A5C8P0L5_9BACI|nr:PucR family transcriptional regulator [Cerasibacillus terrae]TXL66802.1 hypothetical protein FHP05_05370 [Cerasibacillus terrae]